MFLVIGSVAMNRALGFTYSNPQDIDLIVRPQELQNLESVYGKYTSKWNLSDTRSVLVYGTRSNPRRIIEVEFAYPASNAEWILDYAEDNLEDFEGEFVYADINLLYMFKMSHRYLKNSPHFKKTMEHIHLLRQHGAEFTQECMNWYKWRERETYDYSHPSLNQMKRDFFNGDGVTYVYDHDSIHEAVKQGEKPAYQYFKYPDKEVLCSRELFEAADMKVRLNAVLEESYVLALERSQIPFKGTVTPRKSFEIALMKVCTSITSGWFREFAWENYETVLSMYDENYVEHFWDCVANKQVKEIANDHTRNY